MMFCGLLSLPVFAAAAYVAYFILRTAWINRPSAVISVVILASVTLAVGYVSYRFGTDHLLANLPIFELSPGRAPAVYRRLDRLVTAMDIERPRGFVSTFGEPNAFAMSTPKVGVIVIDIALARLLTIDELEAILAHELAHLESHDTVVNLMAFTGLQTVMQVLMMACLPVLLLITGIAKAHAWFRGQPAAWVDTSAWRLRTVFLGVVMVFPAVVTFVLLVRSRRREYAADARAATVTGDPMALARVLRKVEAAASDLTFRSLVPTEEPDLGPLARLLATHPATEDRIKRLQARAP